MFLAGTVNIDETTHAFSDKVLDRAFTLEFWDIDLDEYFTKHPVDTVIRETIENLYNVLRPVHLHFGYRTVKAIVDYVNVAVETDPNDKLEALDQAVFSKVLPKIRGQKTTKLVNALETATKTCEPLSLCFQKLDSDVATVE